METKPTSSGRSKLSKRHTSVPPILEGQEARILIFARLVDQAKQHYKAIAITHAVRRSRNRDREFKELNDKLTNLQQQSNPDVDTIVRTKERLTELQTKKIEGAKIGSRAT